MKIKYIIPLLLIFTLSGHSQKLITGLSYSMGFGIGQTSDYVGRPSWSGLTLEVHQMLKPNVSVGFLTGWNIFSEKTNDIIHLASTDISGEQARYINAFPILVNASYYIKSSKNAKFVPFIRAHAGTYYMMQRFDIGVYTVNNYNWHFGVAPEIGCMISTGSSNKYSILINAKYNYAFDSGTRLSGNEKNDYSFFTLNIGLTFNK